MTPLLIFLLVSVCVIGLIGFMLAIAIILAKLTTKSRQKHSCFPFKYGGFDKNNGYEDRWR